MNQKLACASLLLLALPFSLQAAVPESEAAKLGSSLTPLGAERAGNADGSIPAWDGGLPTNAGSRGADGRLSDPFAADKPLFTITAQNMAQYAANLTPGQQAMLQRYPDYHLTVYPTHRSATYPASVLQAVAGNARRASLVEGGNGLKDFQTAIPFPIPQSGIEALWNHITRYRGGSAQRLHVQATPTANGTYTPTYFRQQFSYRDQLTDYSPDKDNNVLFYFKQLVTAPARLAGDVVLVHETLDQVREPRMAWIYNAGQRRVRRAPQIAYDGPYPASDGLRVADNLDMFNGAPDRYEWKLLGKKEIYVPYNTFTLDSTTHRYDDLIKPGHLNQDLVRYEKHRVWQVEGTLRAGERHIYARRVLFLDEDTWQAVLVDHYDGRGTLWRVGESFMTPLYDKQIPWLGVEAIYDLINGRYLVSGLTNQEKSQVEFGMKASSVDYTPTALRNAGIR